MEKEFTDDIEILLEYSSYEKTCNKTIYDHICDDEIAIQRKLRKKTEDQQIEKEGATSTYFLINIIYLFINIINVDNLLTVLN